MAVCGYRLHRSSRIGVAFIAPDALHMGPRTTIGHLTVCKGIASLRMSQGASIGRANWISGYPLRHREFFALRPDRRPELVLGAEAAITHRHLIDCTDQILIGAYSTIAGYRSQLLTHSIALDVGRQSCGPIHVGAYTFVGTQCILLAGAQLPAYSALAAGSLLAKPHHAIHTLYGGVPACPLKALADDLAYFHRTTGRVT